jgi:hypothetical protein
MKIGCFDNRNMAHEAIYMVIGGNNYVRPYRRLLGLQG